VSLPDTPPPLLLSFLYTQVSTFDDWGDIARQHFDEEGSMRALPTIFFMTFLLIVSFTLLPVVVAVLLGKESCIECKCMINT